MRARLFLLLICTGITATASAAEADSKSVAVVVSFEQRLSLAVSSEVLRFPESGVGRGAEAVLDFVAGARTARDADIVLTVQPLPGSADAGGSARALAFSGEGEGILGGTVNAGAPTVVARWRGGGRRRGSLVFRLLPGDSGPSVVPIRVVLSAP